MDTKSAERLRKLDNRFYRAHAASFAATRGAPWPGWERCVSLARPALDAPQARVFDLASGSLRFERYLCGRFPATSFEFHAADVCPPERFGVDGHGVSFHEFDALSGGRLDLPACDMAACFGFMHHVPVFEQRVHVLDLLVSTLRGGGFAAVSFWCFLNDAGLAARAADTTRDAERELGPLGLDEGDFVLGWQNAAGAYRYCHSFSESELDALAAHLRPKTRMLERFSCDGRTGDLNAYFVMQVR